MLRKTMVTCPDATAAPATTKATVARSGSSRERVNETQNFPAMISSILSSLEMIMGMRRMDQPMPGEPAPGRNINRSPLVTGHELEDLTGRQPLQPALDLFLTVYSGIFLQNRELRDHTGGVAPGAVSPQGADG